MKQMCSEKVFKGWHTYACSNPAKVERNAKWFCGTHDPERVAARKAKKDGERDRERAHAERVRQEANDLTTALGAGSPVWGRNGIEHSIKLHFDDARKLIERLRTAEERVREYEAGGTQ